MFAKTKFSSFYILFDHFFFNSFSLNLWRHSVILKDYFNFFFYYYSLKKIKPSDISANNFHAIPHDCHISIIYNDLSLIIQPLSFFPFTNKAWVLGRLLCQKKTKKSEYRCLHNQNQFSRRRLCRKKIMHTKKERKEIHAIHTREKCETKKMSDTGTENQTGSHSVIVPDSISIGDVLCFHSLLYTSTIEISCLTAPCCGKQPCIYRHICILSDTQEHTYIC